MRMCFVQELVGADLEQARSVCDELYQFFTEDVYKHVTDTYNQQQPQQNQQGQQQDAWNQQTQNTNANQQQPQ